MLSDYDFWMMIRNAVLLFLDAIEKKLGLSPTTAEIRSQYKRAGGQKISV